MNKDDILSAARGRMSEAAEADTDNREKGLDDLKMATGEQWPENVREEREADGKPCITNNYLPQFVRQVTGDLRRMNPAINILPASENSDPETAETIEGLIRQIEYRSDASTVYEQTAESAAASSIGWFRILHDYEDDESFDQEILIKRIRNPFSVYCDPAAEEATRSDAQYVFITEQMKLEEFEKQFPDKSAVDVEHDGNTDGLEHWQNGGKVVVAEYYWKEPITKTIWQMADGSVTDKEPQIPMDSPRKREVKTHKLMWAKISGADILEGPQEQASKSIPVIAVTGEEWHVGEDVRRSSVIRYAKGPQQLYNYHSSASAEYVALQPKAPYIGTVKQFTGLESLWNEANTKNRPYLPYNPDEKAPGAPQRATPPVSSQGIMQEAMKAVDDMKATTGIYDAGLGNRSNESSGVAIRQRQMESDVATSIYSDNMAKAIAQCGRVILEMLPKIYDTQRIIRILGKDDEQKMAQINGKVITQEGIQPVNDFSFGKYDVRVSVGPNYSTMRQETAEGMMNFVSAFPAAAGVTADLIAKAQDWPNADQFAERLKKTLPPGIRDDDDLTPEEQQAAMQAQQAQQAQMQQQLQMQQMEMQKTQSEGVEATADAQKAQLEVEEKRLDIQEQQMELAVKSGQMNEAIGQIVQQEVARALQSVFAQ
ncbi:portal protein [Halocynthiibacter sp. C4]|uniref:portal protein n=1 Tax=Halocynthiibacter sp. C4 TaxID=2992758 RepID=UPI00237A4E0B|nr:portal protein [Halocynthiibacter sp. C4]MDE0590426.1 portal protein [Halocynthiibacter sp. C4]